MTPWVGCRRGSSCPSSTPPQTPVLECLLDGGAYAGEAAESLSQPARDWLAMVQGMASSLGPLPRLLQQLCTGNPSDVSTGYTGRPVE
jgi:hypothetical protein